MQSTSLRLASARLVAAIGDRLRDPSLLLLRLCWGWLFFSTGWGKLGHLAATSEFFASLGIPAPGANALVVGLLECVGGLLLMLGWLARPTSLLLLGNMMVAYLTAHRDAFASLEQFVAAEPYPYLLAALLVLAFGPGRLSLDALLRRGIALQATLRSGVGA